MSESQSLYIFHGSGFHECECRKWGGAGEPQLLPVTLLEEQKCYWTSSTVSMCWSVCVCLCVCVRRDWVWIGMHWSKRVSSKQTDSDCRFLFSGDPGGLAECWADGRKVEKPTERPGAVLQRPGLAIRPGHCAHQAAQQVRGRCRRAEKHVFPHHQVDSVGTSSDDSNAEWESFFPFALSSIHIDVTVSVWVYLSVLLAKHPTNHWTGFKETFTK